MHDPIALKFLATSKSHEALETAHSITVASCATPFSSYVRMRRATLNFELSTVCGVNAIKYAAIKMRYKKTLKMYRDVGITEQQKV